MSPFDETTTPDDDLTVPTMVEYAVPDATYDLLAETVGEVER